MARGCAESSLQDLFRDRGDLVRQLSDLDAVIARRCAGPLSVRDMATLEIRRYSRERVGAALDDVIFEALQARDET